jgi:plasmid stabilization system protein ParE
LEKSLTKIVWTDPAKRDLREIYDFYREVSAGLAERMVLRIVSRADVLLDGFPRKWPSEPLLIDRPYEYRFLLIGNYKIIFRIEAEVAVIDCVFDARRNPVRLENRFE